MNLLESEGPWESTGGYRFSPRNKDHIRQNVHLVISRIPESEQCDPRHPWAIRLQRGPEGTSHLLFSTGAEPILFDEVRIKRARLGEFARIHILNNDR